MKRFYVGLLSGLLIGLLLSSTTFAFADQPIKLIVNGVDITPKCDVPPQIIDGRTLVPARFLAEALGATVEWDPENKAVVVAYNGIMGNDNYETTSKSTNILEIVDGVPMPSDYWKPLNLVGAKYYLKHTFYWEYNDDLYISWHVIEKILRDKKGYFLSYEGIIYPTEEDWLQHKKAREIGQIKIWKFQDNSIQVTSIKEINKTGLLSLEWDSSTQTLYVH